MLQANRSAQMHQRFVHHSEQRLLTHYPTENKVEACSPGLRMRSVFSGLSILGRQGKNVLEKGHIHSFSAASTKRKISEIVLCNYTYIVKLEIIHIPLLVIIHGSCVERDLGSCLSETWPQT